MTDEAPIADPTVNEGEVTEAAIDATTVADTIQDGAATKDETVSSDTKNEDTTTMDEMMDEAEAAVAAGSALKTENAEESAVVPTPTAEDNKDVPAADVKEETSEGQAVESATDTTMENAKVEPSTETGSARKETKKRVRRVGRTPTRKIPKLDEKLTSPVIVGVSDNNNANVSAASADAATAAIGAVPETAGDVAMGSSSTIAVAPPPANQGVLSKHDEKWHAMFQKLMEFKERNKHTLVPQCYTEDPRLGRWVHYQRVEYWIFQQKGTAKITEERIARLNNIGFEWDPQKAQWEKMFAKLKEFKKEFSHCRVPKGYDKDWELANWVRNQRLEQANLSKEGKKSRMTPERFKLLDDLGFKWSSPTPARARRNKQLAKKDESNSEEQKAASSNGTEPVVKSENAAPPASTAAAPDSEDKAMETETPAAQAEAMTAATNVVGDLPAVEASTNEENGFVQDAIDGKTAEEETKTDAQVAVPLDNENPVVIV